MKRQPHVLIISAHWNNRGDEAALRSLIDSLKADGDRVSVQLQTTKIYQFPYDDVETTGEYPRLRNLPAFALSVMTNFRFIPNQGKKLIEMIRDADLILHAPGGPSIGDIYGIKELNYLSKLWAAIKMGKPYIFCAPSAGPFNKRIRNIFRRAIYKNAAAIILREEISQGFLNRLMPRNKSIVTCDMALQNEIHELYQEEKMNAEQELMKFLERGKVVGVTITDLRWHPVHGRKRDVQDKIKTSFTSLVKYLTAHDYKTIFIPQLFGLGNDYKLMEKYCLNDKCYVLPDTCDAYFQQYLIGKLYAVVGMRYHSNVFSAKMGVPFISVSYEQKTRGFMNKIKLNDYCIELQDLSAEKLIDKFRILEKNRDSLAEYLGFQAQELKKLSHKTVEIIESKLNGLVE